MTHHVPTMSHPAGTWCLTTLSPCPYRGQGQARPLTGCTAEQTTGTRGTGSDTDCACGHPAGQHASFGGRFCLAPSCRCITYRRTRPEGATS